MTNAAGRMTVKLIAGRHTRLGPRSRFERLGQPIKLGVWDSARHFRLGSRLDFPGLCKGYSLASRQ